MRSGNLKLSSEPRGRDKHLAPLAPGDFDTFLGRFASKKIGLLIDLDLHTQCADISFSVQTDKEAIVILTDVVTNKKWPLAGGAARRLLADVG